MNRRSFLASSAAGATTAATAGIASAAQLTPPGETAAPIPYGERLPLGPLPGSRYPDTHIEALDAKRFKGSPGTGAVENGSPPACAGRRGRLIAAPATI